MWLRCCRLIWGLGLAACLAATAARAAGDRPIIYTSFYPTEYFAARIAQPLADVINALPDGADPIFWVPDRATLAALQQADLILLNGAGLERWTDLVTLPEDRTIVTAMPFEDQWLRYENAVTHSHGTDGEHSHEGLDGHTWLDPVLAKAQAESIRSALVARFPDHADAFAAGYARLAADLDQLDDALTALAATVQDTPLFMSHPAYNYIARRYGWNFVNLDLDPEVMPSEEDLAAIRVRQQAHPASILIWESAPQHAVADRFHQELGVQSVVFTPAENPDGMADYLAIMAGNIERLRTAIAALSS